MAYGNVNVPGDLSGKQDLITGVSGQVVGIGADGKAAARNGWSNPSLLINWYLADPINQRGKTAYTGNGAYSIDMWRIWGALVSMAVDVDCVHVSGGGSEFSLRQNLERKLKNDQTYTFTVLFKSLGLCSITGSPGTQRIIDGTSIMLSIATGNDYDYVNIFSSDGNYTMDVVAAKLELGPVQTLAHKEGDTWVLNDPPPNMALELAKCQRYQFNLGGAYTAFGNNGNSRLLLSVPNHNLRTSPTISGVNVLWYLTINGLSVTNSEASVVDCTLGKDRLDFILDIPGGQFSAGQAVQLAISSGLVDANL